MSNPIYFGVCVAVARVRSRFEDGRLKEGVYSYSLIPSGNSGRKKRGWKTYSLREDRKEL